MMAARHAPHASAYVSIRQHTSASVEPLCRTASADLMMAARRSCPTSSTSCIASSAEEGCIRQHTSAYVSIRPHTSAYVTPAQRPARLVSHLLQKRGAYVSIRQHTSAYVSIRQHTSAYVTPAQRPARLVLRLLQRRSAYDSIRQHTSAYVSIRQHTAAYGSIRQNTAAYARLSAYLQRSGR
jgi:hypothetical protein